MKNKILIITAGVLSALFLFIPSQGEESLWEKVKSENSIEIFIRPFPGSAIKEYRGVMVMQSSISSVLAMLDDTASYTRWMYRCSEAVLLNKKNFYERITYSVAASPWPVDDRDIAVKSVISQNKNTGVVTIELSGLPDYVGLKPGKVRVKSLRGYWIIEPLGGGLVRVTNRLHSEPGGYVPDSIANSSLVDLPYNTLYNMRRMILQSPYKEAKYKEIIER